MEGGVEARQKGESNVHRRTRVARVGMGGRIGLERGMVSTIDQFEVFLLQIFAMKQLLNGGVAVAAATAMEGQSWPLLCMRWKGMLGLRFDLRPGPGWC